jgi:hypothetical protein
MSHDDTWETGAHSHAANEIILYGDTRRITRPVRNLLG